MTIIEQKKERNLKEPYKHVRHVAAFTNKDEANQAAKILNVSIYKPVGLTMDEIQSLVYEERAKFFVEKGKRNGIEVYEVLERIIY